MRLAICLVVIVIGLALGIHALFLQHWFSAAGYILSALMTSALVLFGAEFLKESLTGAALVLLTGLCGLFAFAFESRGLDVDLDQSRFEAGLAMIQYSGTCPGGSERVDFQKAARACFIQGNLDRQTAVVDASKQAYLPAQLDFADKLAAAMGDQPDICSQLFTDAYKSCPAAFMSMRPAAINALRQKTETQSASGMETAGHLRD